MARRQSWPRFFAGWSSLLLRDAKRSIRRLVVVRHNRRRHSLTVTFNLPGFGRSRWYWRRRWRSRPEARLVIKRLIGASLIGLSLVGLAFLVEPYYSPPTTYVAPAAHVQRVQPTVPAASLKASPPVQLTIPDLHISTRLIRLGLNTDGSMATPSNPQRAGWYKYSPIPGQIGPAVIVGHVDSESGPAVFYNLRKLKPRQTVEVIRRDGGTVKFAVYKVSNYSQRDFPTAAVYGNTKAPELRLITCGGPFNYLTGHYTENTVVFASLMSNPAHSQEQAG